MGPNGNSAKFSQTFLDALKAERNQRYELASSAYAKEAGGLQQKNDLERSALCFLLAGRCKLQAKKNAREEFEKAASIYLEIAKAIRNTSPMNSRMAYRCATRCFLRAELYDKAQEAQSSADAIKDVRGTEGEIKQPVMVVDDSKVVTLKLKKYVTQFGFREITVCNGGKEAVEKFDKLASNGQLPIILLDMVMPDMAGNEVAAHMLKVRPETAIALITAESIDSDGVREALANGVGYFLQKPFHYDEIKELLETILYEEKFT